MRAEVLVIGLALCGCSFIPGTSAYKIERAQEEAAKALIDPSSAQFRSVRVSKDAVCGEINAKNRMGAYVGFSRFVASPTTTQSSGWLAQVDPQFDPADKASADEFCASLRGNSYSSPSTISSACQRAQEQETTELLQKMFDDSWRMACT